MISPVIEHHPYRSPTLGVNTALPNPTKSFCIEWTNLKGPGQIAFPVSRAY
jgi:hypothetical protein